MKFVMMKMRAVAALGAALALTVSSGVSANAATANSYITNWYAGNVGSWRADNVGVTQSILLNGCSVNGGNKPASVQMQLQRSNGIVPLSEGNLTRACGSTAAWGPGVKGAKHRYQYNGHTFQGTFYKGPFNASTVTIKY